MGWVVVKSKPGFALFGARYGKKRVVCRAVRRHFILWKISHGGELEVKERFLSDKDTTPGKCTKKSRLSPVFGAPSC